MKVVKKKLKDLKPADYNPRKMSPEAYAGLKASMERFGLVEPIVWNKRTGNVVGGHRRLEVLQERGEKETLVVVVDLPADEERALNITLNNPNIAGEFTPDLQVILEDIKVDLPEMFIDLKLDNLEIQIPDTPKEYDETAADKVEYIECPQCNYKWPK